MVLRRATAVLAALTALAVTMASPAASQTRGVQFTPDGKRVLVNKDVGGERWAITRNEDGTATGNVFRTDGSDPAFVFCAPLDRPNGFACFGADACTDESGAQRGIQSTPDAARLLVQKDVGDERWSISLNLDDGTATGNVFRADGGEPAFVACEPTGTANAFVCAGADKCLGTPCTQPFSPIAEVELPAAFFTLPNPCAETYVPLGEVTLPPSFFEPVATVTFTVTASPPVQAFHLRVSYAPERGSFVGRFSNVSCVASSAGVFIADDDDLGTLVLVAADPVSLEPELTIRCGFSALGVPTSGDFGILVREVVQDGVQADPAILRVAVTVD